MVNLKWNAEINRYRNILFQWPNQNGHRNGIATNAITRIWSLQEYGHWTLVSSPYILICGLIVKC